jgi:hypothetical protein
MRQKLRLIAPSPNPSLENIVKSLRHSLDKKRAARLSFSQLWEALTKNNIGATEGLKERLVKDLEGMFS